MKNIIDEKSPKIDNKKGIVHNTVVNKAAANKAYKNASDALERYNKGKLGNGPENVISYSALKDRKKNYDNAIANYEKKRPHNMNTENNKQQTENSKARMIAAKKALNEAKNKVKPLRNKNQMRIDLVKNVENAKLLVNKKASGNNNEENKTASGNKNVENHFKLN